VITKFSKYLIKESPDSVYLDDCVIVHQDKDARPFGVITNDDQTELKKLKIGYAGSMHNDSGLDNDRCIFPGRIWLNHKIISFWVYPNDILFHQIIDKLEQKLTIKIWNEGWRIEVKKDNDEIKKREIDDKENDLYFGDDFEDYESELIPIEDYAGSEDFDDIQKKMHLMNWEEKQRMKEQGIKLTPGFGSDRTAWDKPRNLQYRQSIYQENKKSEN
jgi:hypothetical protein